MWPAFSRGPKNWGVLRFTRCARYTTNAPVFHLLLKQLLQKQRYTTCDCAEVAIATPKTRENTAIRFLIISSDFHDRE